MRTPLWVRHVMSGKGVHLEHESCYVQMRPRLGTVRHCIPTAETLMLPLTQLCWPQQPADRASAGLH